MNPIRLHRRRTKEGAIPAAGHDRRADRAAAGGRHLAECAATAAGRQAMNLWNKLMCYSRRHSPWLFHMNWGSCNGCDIELIASLTPRYDAEQLGVRLEGSPRHADILCVTGPITHNAVNAIKTVYGQVCGPKAVDRHRLLPGDDQCLHRQPHPRWAAQQAHSRRCLRSRLPAPPRRHHSRRRQGRRDSGRESREEAARRACRHAVGRARMQRRLRLLRASTEAKTEEVQQ